MAHSDSIFDSGFWSSLAVDALEFVNPSNKVTEPYRGLPFGQYLHAARPRRQRGLTLPIEPSPTSVWQRLGVTGSSECEQRTSAQIDSAFLSRLPVDIRLLIYKMVLGGMSFHVEAQDRRSRVHHFVCKLPERINERTVHAQCFTPSPWADSVEGKRTTSPITLLPLLLTCRKIYSEAIDTLYSANVFEFTQMYAAFRFLTLMIPPQRLPLIRQFRLYMRVPRHPLLNTRTRRDWQNLFEFFSARLSGLQGLDLSLDFLQPVGETIVSTPDYEGAKWTEPMILMAIDAHQRRQCRTEVVTGGVSHDIVELHRQQSQSFPDSTEVAQWQSAVELHLCIRKSLET